MGVAVMWSGAAVGAIGWLISLLVGAGLGFGKHAKTDLTSPHPTLARGAMLPFVIVAALLTVVIFALTLRENPPIFGIGQGFGHGWLLGGLAALMGAWACGALKSAASRELSAREVAASVQNTTLSNAALIGAPLWPVLLGLALISLRERAVIVDALCGFMTAHLAVTLLIAGGSGRLDSFNAARTISRLLAGSVFAVGLGGTILLGTYRDTRTPDLARGTWGAVALGLGLTIAFVPLLDALLATLLKRRDMMFQLLRWGAAAILLLGVAYELSLKLVDVAATADSATVAKCAAIGLIAALAAWWITRDEAASSGFVAPLAALAALGGMGTAFTTELRGVGIGLVMLTFYPALLFALSDNLAPVGNTVDDVFTTVEPSSATANSLVQITAFIGAAVLYRGVETRFNADLRAVAITDQYALWGFLAGAIVPSVLTNWQQGRASEAASTGVTPAWLSLTRTLLAGAVSLALPAVLTLFFGPKCALALIMGLAVGSLVRPVLLLDTTTSTPRPASATGPLAAGWALFGASLIVGWTHRLLPLAELTRAHKMRFLTIVLLILVALWVASEFSAWWEKRGTTRGKALSAA